MRETTYQSMGVKTVQENDALIIPQFIESNFIPILLPTGEQQVAQVPVAVHRFPLQRDQAIELRDELDKLIESVPEPPKKSDLIIAGDSSQAEKMAEMNESFKAGA